MSCFFCKPIPMFMHHANKGFLARFDRFVGFGSSWGKSLLYDPLRPMQWQGISQPLSCPLQSSCKLGRRSLAAAVGHESFFVLG